MGAGRPRTPGEIAPWLPSYLTEPAAIQAFRGMRDARIRWVATQWTGTQNLLISGPTGAGKSLAAAIAGVRLMRDNRLKMHWFRADALSRVLEDRGGSELVTTAKRADLVCIDELGWERFRDVLTEVIGERYDRGLRTIATTGLTIPALVERYGDAVIRRLTASPGKLLDLWDK